MKIFASLVDPIGIFFVLKKRDSTEAMQERWLVIILATGLVTWQCGLFGDRSSLKSAVVTLKAKPSLISCPDLAAPMRGCATAWTCRCPNQKCLLEWVPQTVQNLFFLFVDYTKSIKIKHQTWCLKKQRYGRNLQINPTTGVLNREVSGIT